MKEHVWELVQEFENEQPSGQHPMVVIDHTIYVIDGKRLLKMEVPRESIWQKIWKLIRFK